MGSAVGPEQDTRYFEVGVFFQCSSQETHVGTRGSLDIQNAQTGFQRLDRKVATIVPRGDLALEFGNCHLVPMDALGLGNDMENHRPFPFLIIQDDFLAPQDTAPFPQGDGYAHSAETTSAHDDFDGNVASGVHHFIERQMGNADIPDAQRVADSHRIQGQIECLCDPERIASDGEIAIGNQDGGAETAGAETAFERGKGAADVGACAVSRQGINFALGQGRQVLGEPITMDAVTGFQGLQRVTGKYRGKHFVPRPQAVRQSHARRGVDEQCQSGRFGPLHQHARNGFAEDCQKHGGGRDP